MAGARTEEADAGRMKGGEGGVTATMEAVQEGRDARIAELERGVEEQREQLDLRRSEQLQEARDAEKNLRALLRENTGKVLTEDAVYIPTGERIAQQGAVADATHMEHLDRVAQEHRDLIVESARTELDRARADAERQIERARMDAEGEIAAVQDKLVADSNEIRAQTETRRRDLEALKRNDLLQEQKDRELKDFEDRLGEANPDLPRS